MIIAYHRADAVVDDHGARARPADDLPDEAVRARHSSLAAEAQLRLPISLEQLAGSAAAASCCGNGGKWPCPLTGNEDDWILVPPSAALTADGHGRSRRPPLRRAAIPHGIRQRHSRAPAAEQARIQKPRRRTTSARSSASVPMPRARASSPSTARRITASGSTRSTISPMRSRPETCRGRNRGYPSF